MRTPFDQLGKQIGREALGSLGLTVVHDEISPEAQYADLRHEPDPRQAAARARLGLLGRIASGPCMIELYGHAPSGAELRACLAKHLASWQQQARRARRHRARKRHARRRSTQRPAPTLWIVAAGRPTTLMAELRPLRAPGWPRGVYAIGGDVLRVRIVAASELPRERSTLLVRLMAGGARLPRTVAELSALPRDAPERAVADQILLRLRHALERAPKRSPLEEEFIVTMYKTWDDARDEGREEGLELGLKRGEKRGEKKGLVKGQAAAILTVLRARRIPVSEAARARIRSEKDPARLKRWLERAIVARSVTAVLRTRS